MLISSIFSGIKVLVAGPWCTDRSGQLSSPSSLLLPSPASSPSSSSSSSSSSWLRGDENRHYSIHFDGFPVPTQLVQAGLLRCFSPKHEPGFVTLQVACNDIIISNSVMFEYRSRDQVSPQKTPDYFSFDENLFQAVLRERCNKLASGGCDQVANTNTTLSASNLGTQSASRQNDNGGKILQKLLAENDDDDDDDERTGLKLERELCRRLERYSPSYGNFNIEDFLASSHEIVSCITAPKPFAYNRLRDKSILHLAVALGYGAAVERALALHSILRRSSSLILDLDTARLRCEVDPCSLDRHGNCPLAWAQAGGHVEIAQMLLRYRAALTDAIDHRLRHREELTEFEIKNYSKNANTFSKKSNKKCSTFDSTTTYDYDDDVKKVIYVCEKQNTTSNNNNDDNNNNNNIFNKHSTSPTNFSFAIKNRTDAATLSASFFALQSFDNDNKTVSQTDRCNNGCSDFKRLSSQSSEEMNSLTELDDPSGDTAYHHHHHHEFQNQQPTKQPKQQQQATIAKTTATVCSKQESMISSSLTQSTLSDDDLTIMPKPMPISAVLIDQQRHSQCSSMNGKDDNSEICKPSTLKAGVESLLDYQLTGTKDDDLAIIDNTSADIHSLNDLIQYLEQEQQQQQQQPQPQENDQSMHHISNMKNSAKEEKDKETNESVDTNESILFDEHIPYFDNLSEYFSNPSSSSFTSLPVYLDQSILTQSDIERYHNLISNNSEFDFNSCFTLPLSSSSTLSSSSGQSSLEYSLPSLNSSSSLSLFIPINQLTLNECGEKKQIQRIAAQTIQKAYRNHRGRTNNCRSRTESQAALVIQHCYRRYKRLLELSGSICDQHHQSIGDNRKWRAEHRCEPKRFKKSSCHQMIINDDDVELGEEMLQQKEKEEDAEEIDEGIFSNQSGDISVSTNDRVSDIDPENDEPETSEDDDADDDAKSE